MRPSGPGPRRGRPQPLKHDEPGPSPSEPVAVRVEGAEASQGSPRYGSSRQADETAHRAVAIRVNPARQHHVGRPRRSSSTPSPIAAAPAVQAADTVRHGP
jgi:hypothetical protein